MSSVLTVFPTAVIKFQYVASRIKSAQLFFGIFCNHFHWNSLSLTKYSLTSQFAKQTVFHGFCLVISLDLLLDFHCLFYPSVQESGCVSASPISIWISSIRNSVLCAVVHEIARHAEFNHGTLSSLAWNPFEPWDDHLASFLRKPDQLPVVRSCGLTLCSSVWGGTWKFWRVEHP